MGVLEPQLKEKANQIGFDLVGIAPAVSPPGVESLRDWLSKGYEGEMGYMRRHAEAREHPQSVLHNVKSVVMAGMNYRTRKEPPSSAGRISSYAWGKDYHDVLRDRLRQLLTWLKGQVPGLHGRVVVDTAPLLERDFARLAGLGWFGKNTMLLNKRLGSYFFIGALLLDVKLEPDKPFETSHCGACTACLDACPTQAFVGPGQLDARKCISYLTIELRGPVPGELREPMGDWIFGCDICQDVCPWNRKAPLSTEPQFQPRYPPEGLDLVGMLSLSQTEFGQRFRGTTITRSKRGGFLRNVAIALGNQRDLRAVPGLIEALKDEEPIVRGAAAWALGRIATASAFDGLQAALDGEQDAAVREELLQALARRENRRTSEGFSQPIL